MVVLSPEVPAAVGLTGLTRTLRRRIVVFMNIRAWIIVTLYLLPQATPLWSADDSVAEKHRNYLIAGMRAEREKLRSGHAILTGEHAINSPDVQGFRVPVRYEIAFDYDSRSFRYTQSDFSPHAIPIRPLRVKAANPDRPELGRGKTTEGREWAARASGGTVVHTPEYDLHRPIDSRLIARLAPGNLGRTSVKEWDMTALGLMDWPTFERGLKRDEILDAAGSQLQCHSVDVDASGISRLKVRSDWTEYEMWIDEKQGMTPIRISRKDLRDSLKETSRSDVSWKLQNGVWVPESFRIEDFLELGSTQSYVMTIEWKSVNEPLDSKLFSPEGITDDKAFMTDMRLGPGVLERVKPKPLPVIVPKPVKLKPPSRLGWIVLGHLVACGLFAWWYYRRKSRRQSA